MGDGAGETRIKNHYQVSECRSGSRATSRQLEENRNIDTFACLSCRRAAAEIWTAGNNSRRTGASNWCTHIVRVVQLPYNACVRACMHQNLIIIIILRAHTKSSFSFLYASLIFLPFVYASGKNKESPLPFA